MRELPSLGEQHVEQLILRSMEQYRRTHMAEVEAMIAIKDSLNTIKTEEMGRAWKVHLWDQWQIKRPIKEVSEDIVKLITRKCRGNPYICLDYFK